MFPLHYFDWHKGGGLLLGSSPKDNKFANSASLAAFWLTPINVKMKLFRVVAALFAFLKAKDVYGVSVLIYYSPVLKFTLIRSLRYFHLHSFTSLSLNLLFFVVVFLFPFLSIKYKVVLAVKFSLAAHAHRMYFLEITDILFHFLLLSSHHQHALTVNSLWLFLFRFDLFPIQ